MFAFYFVISWTPKLLVTSGASAAEGITGGVLFESWRHWRRHPVQWVGILRAAVAADGRIPVADGLGDAGVRVVQYAVELGLRHGLAHRRSHVRCGGRHVRHCSHRLHRCGALNCVGLGRSGWGASVPSCRRSAPVYCWMRDGRRRGCLSCVVRRCWSPPQRLSRCGYRNAEPISGRYRAPARRRSVDQRNPACCR